MTEHLDDDSLSQVLDGARPPAHLAGCRSCSARLDRLAEARTAIAAVGAPAADRSDDHVAAALRAVAVSDGGSGGAGEVVPIGPRVPPRWRWIGAAAAAVVALVGIVGVVSSGSPDTTDTAATGEAQQESSDLDETAALSDGATVASPDLGPIDDAAALARSAGALIGGPSRTTGAGPPSAGEDDAGSGSAGDGTESDGAGAAPLGRAVDPGRCPDLAEGPVLATATLVWQGTDAELLVVVRGVGQFAIVLAEASCEILAQAPLGR